MGKELVDAIERLGDYISITLDLAKNIYEEIKNKEGIHDYSVGIFKVFTHLNQIGYYYDNFHLDYLGKLQKVIKTNVRIE